MALFKNIEKFKKQKSAAELPGRRRPLSSDQGSQRTQAFSYYSQRSAAPANTGRSQAINAVDMSGIEAKPWFSNRLFVTASVAVVLIFVLYMTSLTSSPQVVPLATSGSAYFLHDSNVYQQAAGKSLRRSLFNKNKLTIDGAAVSRDLKSKYPELSKVTVTVPLIGHQPKVYITPYEPSFMLSTADNKVFLIDTNGRALASNSQVADAPDIQVPTLEDKSGLSIHTGGQALPADTVQFIRELLTLLAAAKVSYSQLVLPPASSELDVYVSEAPYYVKFNLQGDAKLEVGTFLATMEQLDKVKVTPAQYIDVRVADRAYYK